MKPNPRYYTRDNVDLIPLDENGGRTSSSSDDYICLASDVRNTEEICDELCEGIELLTSKVSDVLMHSEFCASDQNEPCDCGLTDVKRILSELKPFCERWNYLK